MRLQSCIAIFFILSLLKNVHSKSLTIEVPHDDVETLSFRLIHVNDIHAHFDPINEITGRCNAEQAENGKCFGGVARLKTAVDEIKNMEPKMESLFLNAGDYYQGTIWYSILKFRPMVKIAKLFGYTAMGVGNHDFDDGSEGLLPFVANCSFPVLGANLNLTSYPELGEYLKKSTIVTVKGVKIGIIGYITKDRKVFCTECIENIDILDEIASVQDEAKRLKGQGVDIIIAAGHAGYDIDMKMAEQIEELDLVVGGHSHTYLFTREDGKEPPSIEKPKGDYPTYIKQESGKVVPVVQVYCYTKYLGHLELHFDANGELLTPVKGRGVSFAEPKIMRQDIPEDKEIKEALEEFRDELKEYQVRIGETTEDLMKVYDGESNIGNLVTDAARTCYWKDTTISFQNNGGIRSNILKGELTYEDVFSILPFNNTIDRITMTGGEILETLEEAISDLCANMTCNPEEFLQVSGIKMKAIVRDDNSGNRIQSLETLCSPNGNEYCDVEENTVYNVSLCSFLATQMYRRKSNLHRFVRDRQIGIPDHQCLKEYIEDRGTISPKLEGRIVIDYETSTSSITTASMNSICVPLILLLLVTNILK